MRSAYSLPDRAFDKLSNFAFADRFNTKSEYEIIMEHPQPLYLLESRFEKETNGVWGELSGEEKYAYSDEFYWLDKLDFFLLSDFFP